MLDTVAFADLFPSFVPAGGILALDEDFDEDTGNSEASTNSTLSNGTDPDTAAFGDIFVYSPNENAVSSLDTVDTDWVIPAGVCDPINEQPQTVPIYCSANMNTSSCANVMIGGAENTIVKMPSTCGPGPYARISSLNIHPSPESLGLSAEQMAQKPASEPVFLLTFDFDFSVIPEENGPIFMRADMTDMPGYWDDIVDEPNTRKRGIRVSRELEHAIEPRWGGSFTDWLAKVTAVKNGADATRTFHWNDSWTIFNETVKCPTFDASLKVGVNGTAAMNAQYGYYLQATVVPPSIIDSYIYFTSASAVNGQFSLSGKANVTYNSTKVTFAQFGFPGMSVPGLITIGPSLVIQGFIQGQLALDGQFNTSLGRTFPDVSFSLGKNAPDNFSAPVVPDIATQGVSLETTYDVDVSGNLSLHVVPSIQIGLSILNGQLVDAQAFVAVDLFGGVHVNGSVSSAEAPQLCVGAFYGVSVDVGLEGMVPYWEAQPLEHNFFETQQQFFSKCFNSSANPGSGEMAGLSNGTLALGTAVLPRGLSSAHENTLFADKRDRMIPTTTRTGATLVRRDVTASPSPVPGNLLCPAAASTKA